MIPRTFGLNPVWGTAGLTAAASIAGWVELLLVRRAVNRRIGRTGLPFSVGVRLGGAAFVAAGVGWSIKLTVREAHPIERAVLILLPFGAVYLAMTTLLGVTEARRLLARVRVFTKRRVGD